MNKTQLPQHIKTEPKEWAKLKRRQMDEALRALERVHTGCAFVPEHLMLIQAHKMLKMVRTQMQVRNWKVIRKVYPNA